MPSSTNSHLFCADYTAVAACLFAIEAQKQNGAYNADLQKQIDIFEHDTLKVLYNRSLRVLGIITGNITITPENLIELGDFYEADFNSTDFYTGYIDYRTTGFGSRFQTVLNIFAALCPRQNEISEAEKANLDLALGNTLDVIDELQAILTEQGLNPCAAPVFKNNSPELYLQAAGSDGSDNTASGIHLRWSLAGELGENHLPKGNYANDVAGTFYNRADDFVFVSRTPYLNRAAVTLDFESQRPIIHFEKKRWTYRLISQANGFTLTNKVRLFFEDSELYNQIAAVSNPVTHPFTFLKQYTGGLRLEFSDKKAFSIIFDFKETSSIPAVLKVEALSLEAENNLAVTARKTFQTGINTTLSEPILADNISSVRFKKSVEGFLQAITFETYDDFLNTRAESVWASVGNGFGVSLDDAVVFERLEKPGTFNINHLWPHYNQGLAVEVTSYQAKWTDTDVDSMSVKATLSEYLNLSKVNPRAIMLPGANAANEVPGIAISYLDTLKLISLDYHFARMLGLGHIDTPSYTSAAEKLIYRITYAGRSSLHAASNEVVSRSYLSLPTGITDYRLPVKPAMRPVTYALPTGNEINHSLFDASGYALSAPVRIVNIGREAAGEELASTDFFADLNPVVNFNIFEHTKPVFYGLEYRREGEVNFVKPEITSRPTLGETPYYAFDTTTNAAVPETVPVLDNPQSLYVHQEKEPGKHYYAIYGINWFSRVSPISNEAETTVTTFPKKNNLVPPADLAVQYIQKEDTLLFTTSQEQNWLAYRNAAYPGKDVGFTRLTFNWLDMIDVFQHQNVATDVIRPNKIKAYFKSSTPLEIRGEIRRITQVSGKPNQLMVFTAGYTMIDGADVQPVIEFGNENKFIGSVLVTEEGKFTILAVTRDNTLPVFTIAKTLDFASISQHDIPGLYGAKETSTLPQAGSRFLVIENLAEPNNWEVIHKQIDLPSRPLVTETINEEEGTPTVYAVGGIWGNAVIEPVTAASEGIAEMPGYYKITFEASVTLAPHPQNNPPDNPNDPTSLQEPHVEWYRGLIRVPQANPAETTLKLLDVLRIDKLSPLTLYAYDPTYQESSVIISATGSTLVNSLNFHPGYRVYLYPEPLPTYGFNHSRILPVGPASDKQTLIGLQTIDTVTGSGFSSPVSPPAVLLARQVLDPMAPNLPEYSGFKIRPDFTGQGAFTLEAAIATGTAIAPRKPFGFLFYRTTQEAVLNALYLPATITNIMAALKAIADDAHYNERFRALANVELDSSGNFLPYPATTGYRFPLPDKEGLAPSQESYQAAIASTFLPLTEQPPLYSFIKFNVPAENKTPKLRTLDGEFLDIADPEFDPFPMVRGRTDGTGNTFIRFTDYNLQPDSGQAYFYAVAEINNQLVPSAYSKLAGPVAVLNTRAPEVPVVRSLTMGPGTVNTSPLQVIFRISPFAENDYVSGIKVYRSFNLADAASIRTMHLVTQPGTFSDNLLEIADNFTDATVVPFGQPVYYRLAAVRTIVNENNQTEEIISMPSALVSVDLVDMANPAAPILSYNEVENSLSWVPTANNAIHHLYQMNNYGNWRKIYSTPSGTNPLLITYPLTAPLVKFDADGQPVYNRFKVKVENSSGLFNLEERELTV